MGGVGGRVLRGGVLRGGVAARLEGLGKGEKDNSLWSIDDLFRDDERGSFQSWISAEL